MADQKYHIAQVNIARMRAPLDTPLMADFVNALDAINAVADGSPGFVWRLQDEGGNATSIKAFDDDMIIVNMSVWESIDALFQYVYASDHVDVFRRRAEWFEKLTVPALTMWWVPAGHIPTVQEAQEKHAYLTEHGVTPLAFNFKQRYTVDEMLKALDNDGKMGEA
jgi:hypothetical protein